MICNSLFLCIYLFNRTNENFPQFLQSVINDDTVGLRIESKVPMKIGGLVTPYDVNFDVNAPLTGMGGLTESFAGFNLITNADGSLDAEVNAVVVNPSDITLLQMGALGFNLEYNGAPLATVTASSVSFAPGSNSISMTGPVSEVPGAARKGGRKLLQGTARDVTALEQFVGAMINGNSNGLSATVANGDGADSFSQAFEGLCCVCVLCVFWFCVNPSNP